MSEKDLFRLLTAFSAETQQSKSLLDVETLSQAFRIELTAAVDDPRNPLSEGEFCMAITQVKAFMDEMVEDMNRLTHSRPIAFKHIGLFLVWLEKWMDEPCMCAICQLLQQKD